MTMLKNRIFIAMLGFALIVSAVSAVGGNGAHSGQHYNLNLIGVKGENHLQNDANNGNRIFVSLEGRNRIYLTQNFNGIFNVIDADATDGRAEFTLPAPENQYDADGNYIGPGKYQVFVRAVGKPGGNGQLSTCGEQVDAVTGEVTEMCSLDVVTLSRTKGSQKFTDVTRQMTTVLYDYDADDVLERVDIFDDAYENYLWAYDNNGLKNVQLRFYPL